MFTLYPRFFWGMGSPRLRLYFGTYTRSSSRGIYCSELDPSTGALSPPVLAAEAPNPTFLALAPDGTVLYAVCAGPQWASSFQVGPAGPALKPLHQLPPGAGPTPCHIAVDRTGRIGVAANYHLALAAAFPLGPGGAIGEPAVVAHTGRGPHPTRQDSAHVHSASFSPDGRYALVCDLGLDRVYTYRVTREPAGLKPASPAFVASQPGAGPRHLAFGRSGRNAYVIHELNNTVVTYAYEAEGGTLKPLQAVSVLPGGYSGAATAAEVQVHPGGRFLYGSSRGPDTLAVFAIDPDSGLLSPVEVVPCGGKGPRHFSISPDGMWLVCAHQDSDTACSFRIDATSGRLSRVEGTIALPMPVCVVFALPS